MIGVLYRKKKKKKKEEKKKKKKKKKRGGGGGKKRRKGAFCYHHWRFYQSRLVGVPSGYQQATELSYLYDAVFRHPGVGLVLFPVPVL